MYAHLSYSDLSFLVVHTHFSTYYDLRRSFFLAFVSLVAFIGNSRPQSLAKECSNQSFFYKSLARLLHSCDFFDLLTNSHTQKSTSDINRVNSEGAPPINAPTHRLRLSQFIILTGQMCCILTFLTISLLVDYGKIRVL